MMNDPALAAVIMGATLALAYGLRFCDAAASVAKTAVKTLAVAALAAAAWLLEAPALVTLGLALGAAGDFFLSLRGGRAFLAGMAAFAAGHLAYAAAFFAAGAGLPGWAVLIPLLGLGLSTELWLAPHTGTLRWPVRGYAAVILLMTAAALGLPGQGIPGALLAAAGALLFVLSDVILALDLFRRGAARPSRWRGRVLWAAYWCSQALILSGMAAAAVRPV